MTKINNSFFGIMRSEDRNIQILHVLDGLAATRIDADVYPVGSNLSARYEHASGIVLTPEDAEKLGIVYRPLE